MGPMFPGDWPSKTPTLLVPREASPKLPRLVFCNKCGCTYLGKCPEHTPEEGGYVP